MGTPKLPGEKNSAPGGYEFRCHRTDCIYRTPSADTDHRIHSCNYFSCTGKTRIAGLPKDQIDPALCPHYKKGRRVKPDKNRILGEST